MWIEVGKKWRNGRREIEYKRLSVQRKTSMEVDQKICKAI